MPDVDASQLQNALERSEEKYHALFDLFGQGFCICELLVDEEGHPCDYRFLEVNSLFEEHTGLQNAIGKTALELVPLLERHWIDRYGSVVLTGEPLRFEQGSTVMGRWFDVYAFRFGTTEYRQFGIVFNDISRRKRAEERSKFLQELASVLSKSLTSQEVIDNIIQKVMKDIGADKITIALLARDKSSLEIVGSFGYPQQDMEPVSTFNEHYSLIEISIRDNKQWWLSFGQARPLEPLKQESHQAWAVVPFNINGDFIGAISLGFGTQTQFDEAEQTFLVTLTEYCAQALYRAKLTEQISLLAVAQERKRIAHDLHDAVKQILFVSSLIAEGLPNLWERSPEKAKEHTNDIVKLNRAALSELHSLLLEMRPEAIVTSPFMTLVRNLVNGLQGRKTISINIQYEGPEELYLPANTHVALYRLVQETFNNIYKHSHATQLEVACAYRDDLFHIRISDNGRGFDPQNMASGFGINNMRDRAQDIGATLTLKSTPQLGTTITVECRVNASKAS
jgi:signal transduction histidine kinase